MFTRALSFEEPPGVQVPTLASGALDCSSGMIVPEPEVQ